LCEMGYRGGKLNLEMAVFRWDKRREVNSIRAVSAVLPASWVGEVQ